MVSLAALLWVASSVSAQTSPGASSDEALQRGTEAVRASHFEEAERWFQAAVNSGPGNPAAQMELGMVQLRLGKANDAAQHLSQAVAIDPNAPPIPPRPPHQRKPAADFPANLFPWRRRDQP